MLALAIILAAFGITIYFSLSHALRRNIDASIQSQAEWIAGVLDMMDEGLDFGEFIEDLSEHTSERKGELYIQVRQGIGDVGIAPELERLCPDRDGAGPDPRDLA